MHPSLPTSSTPASACPRPGPRPGHASSRTQP